MPLQLHDLYHLRKSWQPMDVDAHIRCGEMEKNVRKRLLKAFQQGFCPASMGETTQTYIVMAKQVGVPSITIRKGNVWHVVSDQPFPRQIQAAMKNYATADEVAHKLGNPGRYYGGFNGLWWSIHSTPFRSTQRLRDEVFYHFAADKGYQAAVAPILDALKNGKVFTVRFRR